MGAWGEGIYANDLAQDLLLNLEELFEKTSSTEKLLTRLKETELLNYSDVQLVVADLEHSLLGETPFVKDTFRLIKCLKKEAPLNWRNPSARVQALSEFEHQLKKPAYLSFDSIPDWLASRQSGVIF